MPGRNPSWTTDELVLALAFYFEHGHVDKRDARVVELSRVLRSLPHIATEAHTYRSPNSVDLKLANLRFLDPETPGGLSSVGHRDRYLWKYWTNRRDECRTIAAVLRDHLDLGTLPPPFPEDEERPEGRLILEAHRRRERSAAIVRKRRSAMRRTEGQLRCEACDITESRLTARYDLKSGDVFEVHHTIPLALSLGDRRTRARDLAILCPTCHRAIHRLTPMPTVTGLRSTILLGRRGDDLGA